MILFFYTIFVAAINYFVMASMFTGLTPRGKAIPSLLLLNLFFYVIYRIAGGL